LLFRAWFGWHSNSKNYFIGILADSANDESFR
jgi:hypothetical protein